MNERMILRGSDSIRFLGDQGITFVLPWGPNKADMPVGWNRPGAGATVEQALAHYRQGKNVGALCEFVVVVDLDFNFPEQLSKLGELAHTSKVWRNNAKERGALIYRVIDGPVFTTAWTPAGEKNPHAELKAQAKTGNFAYKNVAGGFEAGEYCIIDAQLGIKSITVAELKNIWRLLTDEELYRPAKTPTKPPGERKSATPHDDLLSQVKAHWTPLQVFAHHGWVKDGIKQERNETRILGHGGLLCNEEKGTWFNHSEQVGGDCFDAWARCRAWDRDSHFPAIIEEMAQAAGIVLPERNKAPVSLPAGAVIIKTTPTATATNRTLPPAMTPTVIAKLASALHGPQAAKIIASMPNVRNQEMYRDLLIQFITKIAPAKGSWVFEAGQDWLGEQIGKNGTSIRRNLFALQAAALIDYTHTGKSEATRGGRPIMRVDLQPLVLRLWESCANAENSDLQPNPEFSALRNDSPTNLHAIYAGTGQYADATRRTLYKFAIDRMGRPTVLMRSMTFSALSALDCLKRQGEATRAEMVFTTGASLGAVAGGTRVLEQLGLVQVAWDGPGTAKRYRLVDGWEKRLQAILPHMTSYGARLRLALRNTNRWINAIERQVKTVHTPQLVRSLNERKKRLEIARNQLILKGKATGEVGYNPIISPPWQLAT